MPTQAQFIEVMLKHLPPSASALRVLDVGSITGGILTGFRADLQIEVASLYLPHWSYATDSMDAVVAYDWHLDDEFLAAALRVMRPGGRLIAVQPLGTVQAKHVAMLEKAGYIRILVEPAHGSDGILVRGEKAHTTSDTLVRVRDVAASDADLLDLETFRGRYVHLLIRQTPNKPVWKLAPDEKIEWRAAAIEREDETYLLAFSSLPKSVSFMQPAVLGGIVQDVNKVGKFSKQQAQKWTLPVLLNPMLQDVQTDTVVWVDIDPDTAEAPDE